MKVNLRSWWVEFLLCIAGAFFAFRELGTFPSLWLDDSIFMVVARNLAEGRGYTLPVLTYSWDLPYLLAVGPTIIWPAALMIKIFGFSIAVARVPFALMTLISIVISYLFVKKFSNKENAQWVAALLISFSGFINTGKPVLGEVPGFLFLILGILLWLRTKNTTQAVITGIILGLSVVTKLTYGIIFPALGVAWLILLFSRRKKECIELTVIGAAAFITFVLWYGLQMLTATGSIAEIVQYGFADGGNTFFAVLHDQPELLLRFQYLYFGALAALFCLGIYRARKVIPLGLLTFIVSFVALAVFFFLNGPGWYRHLLLAHVLVVLFVPAGIFFLLPRRLGAAVLLFFVLAQGWWQFTYRGSTKTDEEVVAAERLLELYPDTELVIQEPQIYVLLPHSEHRYFLSEEFSKRHFTIFGDLPLQQDQYCLPLVRKMSLDEQASFQGTIKPLERRYVIVDPPTTCATASGL